MRKTIIVCGTAFGLGILGAAHAHTATRALIWISISIGGLSAASPVGWSVPSMIAPRGSVGSVGGIMNFSNQLSGIAAPIVTGYVVAVLTPTHGPSVIAAIYLLIGIASYIFLLGRIEQIPIRGGGRWRLTSRIDHGAGCSGRDASIDQERLSGDVAAGLGGKEDDRPFEIVRLAGTLHGNAVDEVIDPLLVSCIEPRSARCETSPARGN